MSSVVVATVVDSAITRYVVSVPVVTVAVAMAVLTVVTAGAGITVEVLIFVSVLVEHGRTVVRV